MISSHSGASWRYALEALDGKLKMKMRLNKFSSKLKREWVDNADFTNYVIFLIRKQAREKERAFRKAPMNLITLEKEIT